MSLAKILWRLSIFIGFSKINSTSSEFKWSLNPKVEKAVKIMILGWITFTDSTWLAF